MLALIAGTGDLPAILHRHLKDAGKPSIICAMHGFYPTLPVDQSFRIEHLGTFLTALRDQGVTKVCMAGAVKRPPIDPSEIDAQTMPLVPRLQAAMALGDDGTLREIIKIMAEHDLQVVGASELMPELLPPDGCLTQAMPTKQHSEDAALGRICIQRLGQKDQGQACIVNKGRILAEEGPEGTAALLGRFYGVRAQSDNSGSDPFSYVVDSVLDMFSTPPEELPSPATGGILYKAPKPDQDRRVDLPVIGPETALQAAEAGLAGIVIEFAGVMVLDRERTIELLNSQGMFLWVLE